MTRTCKVCGETKDVSLFSKDRTSVKWLCKKCDARRHREYRAANPGCHRKSMLKQKFGITVEEYDALLEKQGGGCAICKTDVVGQRMFPVDHDHATGKVRGILCHNCNHGLGHFKDDIGILSAAITYITESVDGR